MSRFFRTFSCAIPMAIAYTYLLSTPREAVWVLFICYAVLFLLFWVLWKQSSYFSTKEIQIWLGISFFFRLGTCGFLPQLSDDFYRFVWDGKLWANGENPYLWLPEIALKQFPYLDESLFSQLNSPQFYTVYPPVCQYTFGLSAYLSPQSILGNVMFLKICWIIAELLNCYWIWKILRKMNLPFRQILAYFLFPFVIVEGVGNLHSEIWLISGMAMASYYLLKFEEKTDFRFELGVAFGFFIAICSKLIPMIFLPLLLPFWGWKQSLRFSFFTIIICVIAFLPFWQMATFAHILQSTQLYFRHFEFNGSLYPIWKWVLYQMRWRGAAEQNWVLPMGVLAIIAYLSFRQKPTSFIANWWRNLAFVYTAYLLTASTVHPWYILPLLFFCLPTPVRFAWFWASFATITYLHYSSYAHFNHWVILLEYSFLGIWLWKERQELIPTP